MLLKIKNYQKTNLKIKTNNTIKGKKNVILKYLEPKFKKSINFLTNILSTQSKNIAYYIKRFKPKINYICNRYFLTKTN
jgi:hypothetical protein